LTEVLRPSCRVVGIDRRSRPEAGDWFEYDLRDGLPPGLPGRVEVLVHCAAALDSDPLAGDQDCFDVNVRATAQLLSYARRAGAKLFIYISSGSVYGISSAPCRETDALEPVGPYACSKAAAEFLVRAYRPEMRTLCLRLFYPYGPGQQPPRLVPRLIERIDAGEPIPLNGRKGYPRINPLFVDDLSTWVSRFIQGDLSGTYNLAGTETVSIRQLADRIALLLGRTARFDYRDPVAGHLVGDISRVSDHTGFTPCWTLERGLSEMVKEYRQMTVNYV
jgi:nucleoside-diphosphate-sugar epimerase